jgi:hypothetical protein
LHDQVYKKTLNNKFNMKDLDVIDVIIRIKITKIFDVPISLY